MADNSTETTLPSNQEKTSYVNPFLKIVGATHEYVLDDDATYLPVVNMVPPTDNSHGINSLILEAINPLTPNIALVLFTYFCMALWFSKTVISKKFVFVGPTFSNLAHTCCFMACRLIIISSYAYLGHFLSIYTYISEDIF